MHPLDLKNQITKLIKEESYFNQRDAFVQSLIDHLYTEFNIDRSEECSDDCESCVISYDDGRTAGYSDAWQEFKEKNDKHLKKATAEQEIMIRDAGFKDGKMTGFREGRAQMAKDYMQTVKNYYKENNAVRQKKIPKALKRLMLTLNKKSTDKKIESLKMLAEKDPLVTNIIREAEQYGT